MTARKKPTTHTAKVPAQERRKVAPLTWIIPTAAGVLTVVFSVIGTFIAVGIEVGGIQKDVQMQGQRLVNVESAMEKARVDVAMAQDKSRTELLTDRRELETRVMREIDKLNSSIGMLVSSVNSIRDRLPAR